MDQVQAMRIFVRVAEMASFRAAARDFHVSNALVSRAIALLERNLETRLIIRTSRAVSLTETGARYLEGCRPLLEELDHLATAVTRATAERSGTLRVAASSSLSPHSLTALVDEFCKRYPDVEIRLTLIERRGDAAKDTFDVGILAGLGNSMTLIERPVGTLTLVPVATSALVSESGLPSTPTDLEGLPLIALLAEGCDQILRLRHDSGTTDEVVLKPVFSVNNGPMVRLATLRGMGFSILPRVIVQEDLDKGTLVRLLPEYSLESPNSRCQSSIPRARICPRRRARSLITRRIVCAGSWRRQRNIPRLWVA
ncbi:LysR family transcriptional regulator [Caballeronia jiangsuensis]|uniref:LysR family transcriptional regulator n=1 Tax=Caballeronia jiangsuensis TaxID=1458357 RepID=A0ABW9CXZ6_9BURK